MTDQELLANYANARDVDSLGVFVERYQNGLLRFASRMLEDEFAAQDVVQETFLRVARHPKRLIGVDSCHNWLIRVARNICIDHIRRAIRRRRAVEALADEARSSAAAAAPPEVGVVREEERAAVHRAIQGLKPRHRELVILKVQEGKSYKEIAAITGLTVTNVGYLLHHAMKALAQSLRGREASS